MNFICRLILLLLIFLSSCTYNYYSVGDRIKPLPKSDCNVNLALFGARWGKGTKKIAPDGTKTLHGRTAIWSPLFDYEKFDANVKWKLLGPALPNLLGYMNVDGQKGVVTPLYSQHSGHLNSWCVGPLFFPLLRRDYAADGYQSYTVLGLFQFGSFGFSMPFLHIGHQPRALFFQGYREQHQRGQLFETWEGRWGAGF